MIRNGFGTATLAVLLAACGSGGGSPSPAPTPVPVPPVPVPPVVTATTCYAIEGGSGLISRVDFYPGGSVTGPTFTITFTNRQGIVANGQTDRIEQGSTLVDDRPIYAIAAGGVDRVSSILWRQGPGLAPLIPMKLIAPLQPVGDYIKATPTANFYTDVGTEALLHAVPRSIAGDAYRDDVVKAAAHLITAYSLAIGGRVASSAEIGRYRLGIQGYLLPALLDLRQANSAAAAAAAMAVTPDTVFAATTTFLNTPPLSTGLVFPAPTSSGSLPVPA